MNNADKRNFTTRMLKQIIFYFIKRVWKSQYNVAMFVYVCYIYIYVCVGVYITNVMQMKVCVA